MKNNEYGRSAIKLIFTIVILAVVIAGIIFIAQKLWQNNSVKDIETDLLYIKAKCKIIHDKNIIDANEQLLGEKVTEYTENEEVNSIISQSDKWYKLTQENLQEIGLEDLEAEDGYFVNYDELDIIYAKGIEHEKEIYYRLSDLEKAEKEAEEEKLRKELEKEQEEKAKEENPKEEEQQNHEEKEQQEEQEIQEQEEKVSQDVIN